MVALRFAAMSLIFLVDSATVLTSFVVWKVDLLKPPSIFLCATVFLAEVCTSDGRVICCAFAEKLFGRGLEVRTEKERAFIILEVKNNEKRTQTKPVAMATNAMLIEKLDSQCEIHSTVVYAEHSN
jgi:hypothetical protein